MSIKKLLSDYFNGQEGKRDFSQEDLPVTRLQLFREVLKVRFGEMIGLNFLYLIVWIPAVVWSVINASIVITIAEDKLLNLLQTYLLVLFPLIAITGPSTAGISYVMRNWARDEHSFPYSDFRKGFRENWKQALLQSTISGAVPITLYIAVKYYTSLDGESAFFILPSILVFIPAGIWFLTAQIMPTMMVTYQLSFGALVKNSLMISMAMLPRAIGIRMLTLLLPILAVLCEIYFPSAFILVVTIEFAVYATFMLSFNKLVQASFSNYVCEKFLNPKIKGSSINMGLQSVRIVGQTAENDSNEEQG